MRKVVGSNPGEDLYRNFVYFCYRFLEKDCYETIRKTGIAVIAVNTLVTVNYIIY